MTVVPTALKEWWNKIKDSEARQTLIDNRNLLKHCPLCDHNIEDREIAIYQELVGQLYKIYVWCGEHRTHEFSMKDIKHLLDSNGYARFNDLIQCSNGILYRPQGDEQAKRNGKYGMNMGRARAFFKGERTVHLQISMNQITGDWTVLKEVKVADIPSLSTFLTKSGVYEYDMFL
jgi:hypothetical protein